MTTTIAAARAEDVAALAALKLETFRQTFLEGFGIPYPPADLARFEADHYALPVIASELADPERATWIAAVDGRMLGYAQVGPCKLPHAHARLAHGELYQLYVHRDAQGSGMGKALFDRALDHLGRHRPGPVWLGVWSGNAKAQAFYLANGFAKAGDYRFLVGSWYDDEFIFRKG